jgi:hypothetical protein
MQTRTLVLIISPASVVYLIAKAKEFAVKDAASEADPGVQPER